MASAIDPNDIDGSYPVAGQDNNSQGFRDNFTNIKTNFTYAGNEITDLQNKVILKAALTGTTLDNNMNDALLYAAKAQDFSFTKVSIAGTSGAISVNYAAGHYQSITTSGSITLAFASFPVSGSYGYLKLQINITNVAHTVTLPAAVSLGTVGLQGYSAGTITFGATGTYEFGFGSYDGGSTITIFDLNRALTNFTAADLTIDDLTATGNVIANTVSKTAWFRTVQVANTVVSTGNVTGGNITSGGLITITGNVIGGNITTVGQVSATGNITGGNVNSFIRPTAGSASLPPIDLVNGTLTSVPVAGAIEYDGVVLYSTPQASQRGVSASQQFIVLTADYTATDTAAAQKVFNSPANGTITLPASTSYFFEALYVIAPAINMNAVTCSTLFALGGTLTSISYVAETTTGLSSGILAVNRAQGTGVGATVVTTAAPGAAATNFTIRLTGTFRTNTAGTFIPQIAFSGTPGSAPLIKQNSFFRCMPIGTNTVASVGNWS